MSWRVFYVPDFAECFPSVSCKLEVRSRVGFPDKIQYTQLNFQFYLNSFFFNVRMSNSTVFGHLVFFFLIEM